MYLFVYLLADCWVPCNRKTGTCLDFCGKGQACCRNGWHDKGPKYECGRPTAPCNGYHCCTPNGKKNNLDIQFKVFDT